MEDGQFIEYLLNQRVQRKTKNTELLNNIYASKYSKSIKEYLNRNHVHNVPLLIVFNTLYKLPDTFKIKGNSFFVADYGLYDYLYDWNYILNSNNYHEDVIRLCIKQAIESFYLNDEIEIAYWLFLHSEGLEEYKTKDYYNKDTMTHFVDRTDIQEKFTMLHEAGHFLFPLIDKDEAIKQIKGIHDTFIKTDRVKQIIGIKKNDPNLNQQLYEECYCDLHAAQYIVQNIREVNLVTKRECYMLLFNAIFHVYILTYINIMCSLNYKDCMSYFDYQLWELTYRIGNMYIAFYIPLWEQDLKNDIEILNMVYKEFANSFDERMKEIRKIMLHITNMIKNYGNDIKELSKVSDINKINFIKEYLNLF